VRAGRGFIIKWDRVILAKEQVFGRWDQRAAWRRRKNVKGWTTCPRPRGDGLTFPCEGLFQLVILNLKADDRAGAGPRGGFAAAAGDGQQRNPPAALAAGRPSPKIARAAASGRRRPVYLQSRRPQPVYFRSWPPVYSRSRRPQPIDFRIQPPVQFRSRPPPQVHFQSQAPAYFRSRPRPGMPGRATLHRKPAIHPQPAI
jgi:hypothetical protein